MTGRRQPRRDYASGQCLAMLRRGGDGEEGQAEGGEQEEPQPKHGTNAKGDGKRREREKSVRTRQQRARLLMYGWVSSSDLLISTTLRTQLG